MIIINNSVASGENENENEIMLIGSDRIAVGFKAVI